MGSEGNWLQACWAEPSPAKLAQLKQKEAKGEENSTRM
jgi:hypothetical protein